MWYVDGRIVTVISLRVHLHVCAEFNECYGLHKLLIGFVILLMSSELKQSAALYIREQSKPTIEARFEPGTPENPKMKFCLTMLMGLVFPAFRFFKSTRCHEADQVKV